MYPPPKREHNRSCTPREFVEALDKLIRIRVSQNSLETTFTHCDDRLIERMEEECEVVKRQLVDYLLVNNREVGIAVHGDHR